MPKILLAQEDAEARKTFTTLILDFFPTANLQPLDRWEELAAALAAPNPASVLLTDLWWEEEDRGDQLTLLAERFPLTPMAILGRYDLTGALPAGFPIPRLVPDEQLPLRLAEILENLAGREIGSYLLSTPAGPHPLGRLYWARHQQLERSVQILAPYTGSPEFTRAIQTLARINHPAVYSLYESVAWENRLLVALEPVLHPSLLDLRSAGQPLSLMAGARLATALASVLVELTASSIPVRCLGAYDYTVSPKGTPRLRNPAAFLDHREVTARENAQNLAAILGPFFQGEPRASTLLGILERAEDSTDELLRQTREFERQLAEVREIRVRKEELEAAEKTLRARSARRWASALGGLALLGFVAVYARVVFQAFFLDAPGILPEVEIVVPAGRLATEGVTNEIGQFFLDRHEVTIGEYEKFLAAVKDDPAWQRWLPTAAREEKRSAQDLEPRDWAQILRRARKKDRYQDQVITRDTPVFNVDFASAAAYANWKGRRLPTLQEWMRAATGGDDRPYPWGEQGAPWPANLGPARDLAARRDPGDSFLNAAPGESFPQDRGPFGHLDLGGNLSEWAIGPDGQPVVMGGNFTDPVAVSMKRARRQDENRRDPSPTTRLEMIGFRTAR